MVNWTMSSIISNTLESQEVISINGKLKLMVVLKVSIVLQIWFTLPSKMHLKNLLLHVIGAFCA